MIVDESKVNLAEKDIEEWLWGNPNSVRFDCWGESQTVKGWIARQLSVPSGIIDLLGISTNGQIVVVEVKNTDLQAAALTQVRRYTFDIEKILSIAHEDSYCRHHGPTVIPIIVGRSIDDKVFRESEALGVTVITFGVHLTDQNPPQAITALACVDRRVSRTL